MRLITSLFLSSLGWLSVAHAGDLPAMMQPRIITGKGFLISSLFLEHEQLRTISDMRWGDLDPAPGPELVVCANFRVGFVTREGKVLRTIDMTRGESNTPDFFIIPTGDEKGCWFLRSRTETPMADPALLNHQGEVLWAYPYPPRSIRFGSAAVADVDGDGKPEIAISDMDRLRLLTAEGKELWRWDRTRGNGMERVEILDAPEGKRILLHYNAQFFTFDTKGKLLRQGVPEWAEYFYDWCVLRAQDQPYLIVSYRRTTLHKFDGKFVARLDVLNDPDQQFTHYWSDPKAVMVKLDADSPPYAAVCSQILFQGKKLVGFEAVHSELRLFDSKWKLVYHEVIADTCRGLATIPSDRPNEEMILVAGWNKIRAFKLNHGR